MGYMGFGMQSIVYKQKPRKPYTVSRKPSFVPLQNYSRSFKLQYAVKENKKVTGLLGLIILTVLLCFVCFYATKFTNYANEYTRLVNVSNKAQTDDIFNFLMNSGTRRLENDNIYGAYSEFKMAYKIYPNNEQLQQLIIETASVLCVSNSMYCKDLDRYLEHSEK